MKTLTHPLLLVTIILAGCVSAPERSVEVRQAASVVADAPVGVPAIWPEGVPSIFARSAILIDARSGRTLFQKNADMRGPVASTQKLLSALLILEEGGLDRPVMITGGDTLVEPAKLGFRAGEIYSRRSLLKALVIKSENDAVAALAREVAGSNEAFVGLMNQKAWSLGARSSYFANPHGLPAAQFSTARDISRIAFRAYREPVLREMMATPSYLFVFNSGRTTLLKNTNKLLGRYLAVNGMKTGYTIASGRCLVASASVGGRDLIFVQIGSRTQDIFDDAEKILRWGFASL